MMTTNGTDRPHPCSAAGSDTFVCRNATSLSSTPMSRPPASVSQYDRNAPTSAAAMPGTTSSARFVTLSPLTFTTRIAATTARPPPSPQFAPATMSGEMPSIAGTRRFSATALVAIPKRVRLDRNVSAMVRHDRDPEQDQAIDAEVDAGEDGDGADREDVRDDARGVTPELECRARSAP